MKKILSLFAVLFFVASCGGLEDLINEFDDYGSYECYHGNATLPSGTHPEYLVGLWECEGGGAGDIHLYSDGRVWYTVSSEFYADLLEYWYDCGGHPGPPHLGQTGKWIVDETNRLCLQSHNTQPGLYQCQEFTYESETLISSDYTDFYDSDGDYLGREYSDYGTDVCTLTGK